MLQPILITGAAGFIGFSLARRLLEKGHTIVGVDSINDYYDPAHKLARLAVLQPFSRFKFLHADLADRSAVEALFREGEFGPVVHLAAQPGVRYSLTHPYAYLEANFAAFLNVMEGCRHRATPHLIYASSSSVYGANTRLPYSVRDNVDHPISLYAATKKANEVIGHSYSQLYGIPMTGLRFFTVYGPWNRPDMAVFIFAEAIVEGRPIRLFNRGQLRRDFTYIDDVTNALGRLLERPPAGNPNWSGAAPDPSSSTAPWRIYNIGSNRTVEIRRVVELLEKELGHVAEKELLPMQPGDMEETCADIEDAKREFGYHPATSIEDGIHRFAAWFRDFRRQ